MGKVMQKTVIEIEGMLEGLREKHNAWNVQQLQADTMLYALLEGCLDFYRLLKTDEDCFAAFKELGCVKWNKRTRIATMVVKAVFGLQTKKGYTYVRALEAAFAANIGTDGTTTMTHWLNDNGGISGVIGKRGNTTVAQAEREHAINVGKNARAYGIINKITPFESKYVADLHNDGSVFVMLCKYDVKKKMTNVIWSTEDERFVDVLYEDAGKAFMKQAAYTNNRLHVHKQQATKKAAATEKVKASLNKITARVAEAETLAKAA